jgi:hypothetical protein
LKFKIILRKNLLVFSIVQGQRHIVDTSPLSKLSSMLRGHSGYMVYPSSIFETDFPDAAFRAQERQQLEEAHRRIHEARERQKQRDIERLNRYRAQKQQEEARHKEQQWFEQLERAERQREEAKQRIKEAAAKAIEYQNETKRAAQQHQIDSARKQVLSIRNRQLATARGNYAAEVLKEERYHQQYEETKSQILRREMTHGKLALKCRVGLQQNNHGNDTPRRLRTPEALDHGRGDDWLNFCQSVGCGLDNIICPPSSDSSYSNVDAGRAGFVEEDEDDDTHHSGFENLLFHQKHDENDHAFVQDVARALIRLELER